KKQQVSGTTTITKPSTNPPLLVGTKPIEDTDIKRN
ncbi:unnamed protein product, partial [Rotaria sordida]